MLNFILVLFGDAVVFILIQLLLLFLFFYAGTRGRKSKETRTQFGQPSHFVLAYGVISASVIQAISAADMLVGFKLIITIVDLWVIFYLCFSNAWFRGIVAEVIIMRSSKI